jgi:predicted amidohydrolase YtcJ
MQTMQSTRPPTYRTYVLTNASVYCEPDQPPVTAAVAVADGRVAFVGPAEEAHARAPDAQVIDLAGAVIYPGWTDAHGHLLDYAEAQRSLDLRDKQLEGILNDVKQAAANAEPGQWIEGRGWDQNLWPKPLLPTAEPLTQAAESNPVVLTRIDGHAVWVNRAALVAAGITHDTPDPRNGRILRDATGGPTGILLENAVRLVSARISEPDDAELARRLEQACAACARAGLTGVGDATGYSARQIEVLRRLAFEGRLATRVYATIGADRPDLANAMQAGVINEGLLTVRAVKIFADGTLGARGAALLEDYSDQPGHRGLPIATGQQIEELAERCFRNAWQLWTHALGDAACRTTLDALQAARQKAHPDDPRPRIEHAQVVAPPDVPRFGRLGVIASIQPVQLGSDWPWLTNRLGWPRVRTAQVWRDLVRGGARLAGGSDFPVELENPLYGFHAAVTRMDLHGRPHGGWQPEQRLSPRQALCLFTADNAYAMFAEDRQGRLRAGYDADLTVLDRDVLTAQPEGIPKARVLLTMVAGRVVHQDEQVPL